MNALLKSLAMLLMIVATCTLASWASGQPNGPKRLEAEEIVLKSPNGRHWIRIHASNTGTGITLEDTRGPVVSLYNLQREGAAIGLHGADRSTHTGFRAALALDDDAGILHLAKGAEFEQLRLKQATIQAGKP